MKRPLFAVMLLVAVAVTARAQDAAARLDALFTSPGTPYLNGGVLVAENGRIVYQRAFGLADFAAGIPNQTESRFQTASLTKVFTSTAVLQLVEKRRLRLDDPVVRHLPDFPFREVTIRHLLAHTSGLPDLELYEPLVARDPGRVIRNADALAALKEWTSGLAFPPGSQFRYSNTNYVLLALVVEKASGMPYGQYLARHVFAPAGMADTYVLTPQTPPDPRLVKNHILPTMYDTVPFDVMTVDLKDAVKMRRIRYETRNLGATLGDQNVITTTGDLFRFSRALDRAVLLRPETRRLATTATRLADGTVHEDDAAPYGTKCSYGLGWDVCNDAAIGMLTGHNGYNHGVASMLYRNETKGQTVIVYDNADGEDFGPKIASIVNVLNGRPPLPVDRRQSLTREYGRLLLERGGAFALMRFNAMRADAEHYAGGSQRGLNLLGYDLLHNGFLAESLEPFRLNVILHPDDANVYDSFAEALAANGHTSDAIAMYERTLQLDPKREESKRALQRLRASSNP